MTAPQSIADTLEQCIDRAGLSNVLEALAIVCGEKADHIRANWQDAATAGPWNRTSSDLDKMAARVKARGL